MKFTVSQSALMRALTVVAKGMGTNSTIPTVAGVFIRAREGVLEFQTSDLTISMRHHIPANIEEEGEVVIPGKVITNIVKTLPDEAVSFDGGLHNLQITCGKSTYRLNTIDPGLWPEFPELEPDSSIELPSELLAAMVDKVYRMVSRDDSRPLLTGICLTVEDNTIRMVATDSIRLAVCDSSVECPANEAFKMVVPGVMFHDVLSVPSMTDTITIGMTGNQIIFKFGDTTLVARQIEGQYMDYRKLVPTSCATAVELPLEEFSNALRRMSVIAQQNAAMAFDIDTDANLLRLSARSTEQGESSELLPVEVEGQSVSIIFHYRLVADCLSSVGNAENLRLELSGAQAPGVFKSNGPINFLYMLLPSMSPF